MKKEQYSAAADGGPNAASGGRRAGGRRGRPGLREGCAGAGAGRSAVAAAAVSGRAAAREREGEGGLCERFYRKTLAFDWNRE